MVHGSPSAARGSCQSVQFSESIKSTVVLPGTAGNARVFRPLAGGCRRSRPHHRGSDGYSLYRYQSEGKRLLHDQRTAVGNHDILIWVLDSLDSARDSRHVLTRAELELLRAI